MKFWKNWPYWVRGGVVGGGITLIFVASFYVCTLADTTQGSFICLPFVYLGPLLPFAVFFDYVNTVFNFQLSFIFFPIISVIGWFLIGSLIGLLIKYIKLKKKSPLM